MSMQSRSAEAGSAGQRKCRLSGRSSGSILNTWPERSSCDELGQSSTGPERGPRAPRGDQRGAGGSRPVGFGPRHGPRGGRRERPVALPGRHRADLPPRRRAVPARPSRRDAGGVLAPHQPAPAHPGRRVTRRSGRPQPSGPADRGRDPGPVVQPGRRPAHRRVPDCDGRPDAARRRRGGRAVDVAHGGQAVRRAVDHIADRVRRACRGGDPQRSPRAGAGAAQRRAGGGRSAQVGVPGEHVPRAADAAQRRNRVFRGAPRADVRRAERAPGGVPARHP